MKEGTEYLNLFCVFCHQILCPIQQLIHIFPSLLFTAGVPVQAFLLVFHISCEIQLHVGFIFPNPICPSSDSISTFLLGYVTLLPPLVHFSFMSEFSQELIAYPCRSPTTFACLLVCRDGPFLSLERMILEYQQALLDPFSLHGRIPWDSSKQISEQAYL